MSLSKNTGYNLVGALVPLVLALATIPIYVNLVGPERYGALAIAWLILGYFGLFDLGLGRAMAQRIAVLRDAPNDKLQTVFWSAIIINIAAGLVGTCLLYLGTDYFFTHFFKISSGLRPETQAMTPILALAVPVATMTGVATGILHGREKFLEANICNVIGAALFQLIPLAYAAFAEASLPALVTLAVIARLAGLLLMLVRVNHNIPIGLKIRFDRTEAKTILSYGGWVSLSSILSPLMVITDRLLIGSLLGSSKVTIYTIPFDTVQRVSIFPRSLAQALFPKMAGTDTKNSRKMAREAITILGILITVPVITGIFLIKFMLGIWISPEFAQDAAPLATILLAAWWINAFGVIPYARLQAQGRPDIVALIHLIELPFYITMLYFGLTHWGLEGAALAFAARLVFDITILSWISDRNLAQFKKIVVFSIHIILAVLATRCFANFSLYWLVSFVVIALSTSLYISIIMPTAIRDIIKNLITKKRIKIRKEL